MNLFLFGIIDDCAVNKTIKKIVNNPEDPNITVYINSHGGDGDCDYAIYETLRLCGKKVTTFAVHYCHSAAMTVFLAGDERYAHKHSSFMVHEVYHEICTEKRTASSYRKSIAELQKMTEDYFSLIAKRSKLTVNGIKASVKKAPENDWYFDSDYALEHGVVTKIGLPTFNLSETPT